jgi:hypothetical protein
MLDISGHERDGGELTHGAIPALGIGISAHDGSVASLKVLLLWGLDGHPVLGLESDLRLGSLGG